MLTLDWIGKKAVVNHHREVPFHLLKCNDELSVGNPGSGNLLVQECKRTSFSLQTGTDRFYPDFLCQLDNGKVLAVEYKNSRDWELPENIEKRQLGALWEKRSDERCLFVMPKGKDWEAIRKKSKE